MNQDQQFRANVNAGMSFADAYDAAIVPTDQPASAVAAPVTFPKVDVDHYPAGHMLAGHRVQLSRYAVMRGREQIGRIECTGDPGTWTTTTWTLFMDDGRIERFRTLRDAKARVVDMLTCHMVRCAGCGRAFSPDDITVDGYCDACQDGGSYDGPSLGSPHNPYCRCGFCGHEPSRADRHASAVAAPVDCGGYSVSFETWPCAACGKETNLHTGYCQACAAPVDEQHDEVRCTVCGEWLPEVDDPWTWRVYNDDQPMHDACARKVDFSDIPFADLSGVDLYTARTDAELDRRDMAESN